MYCDNNGYLEGLWQSPSASDISEAGRDDLHKNNESNSGWRRCWVFEVTTREYRRGIVTGDGRSNLVSYSTVN